MLRFAHVWDFRESVRFCRKRLLARGFRAFWPRSEMIGIAFAFSGFQQKHLLTMTTSESQGEITMSTKSNRNTSGNEQLPLDLNDLITAIQGLPEEYRKQLEQPLDRVVEYTRRRRRILNLIQEALSQLRMDMKYLMFDLEATRRERDSYKNALEGEI